MRGEDRTNIPGKRNNCKGPKAEKKLVGTFRELQLPIYSHQSTADSTHLDIELLISSYAMQTGFLLWLLLKLIP